MGRLLLFLGIVLILVGVAGIAFGIIGTPLQFMNTINQAINPTAEELCNPGEELEQESGPEYYTPGQGYGRNVRFFCVDSSGERREVTGDFVQGMFGDVLQGLGSFAIPLLSSCVLTVGIIFAVIGALLSRRGRGGYATAVPAYQSFQQMQPTSIVNQLQQQGGDLSTRLRKLDEALQANLITKDEYERLRQAILDQMK
jgi:hypothetical protein